MCTHELQCIDNIVDEIHYSEYNIKESLLTVRCYVKRITSCHDCNDVITKDEGEAVLLREKAYGEIIKEDFNIYWK